MLRIKNHKSQVQEIAHTTFCINSCNFCPHFNPQKNVEQTSPVDPQLLLIQSNNLIDRLILAI